MFTGGPPFTGDSPSALAWQHPTPPGAGGVAPTAHPTRAGRLGRSATRKEPGRRRPPRRRRRGARQADATACPAGDPATVAGPVAAAYAPPAARAGAAVVARIQTMPALDPDNEPPAARGCTGPEAGSPGSLLPRIARRYFSRLSILCLIRLANADQLLTSHLAGAQLAAEPSPPPTVELGRRRNMHQPRKVFHVHCQQCRGVVDRGAPTLPAM